MTRRLFPFLILAILSLGTVGCGFNNESTPAGYMGYVTRGAVFGKDSYYGVQQGPTSTGLGWLLHVKNISITPYTYTEPMEILAKDNLKIKFQMHIVWRVKSTEPGVKRFVEKYSMFAGQGDDVAATEKVVKSAYDDFLKEPMRTAARKEIRSRDALLVKEQIDVIGSDIEKAVRSWVEKDKAPFEVMSIVVGDISYPDQVANAVAEKMAATQLLEKQTTMISIEQKKKEMRVIEAGGIAEAMKIINERLTPVYLQHEAIEAQKMMVGSPNHTTIYIPSGANGVPLTGIVEGASHATSGK